MSRAAVETLLLALDHSWKHEWESLVGVLHDIEEEEAAWSGPAYDDCDEALAVRAGSIHWHVNHLAGCKLYYIAELAHVLDPGSPRRADDQLEPMPTYVEERERLEEIRNQEFDQIATLTDEDLAKTTTNGKSIVEFIVATTRHDTWHGGQIAVARRLYRNRHQD